MLNSFGSPVSQEQSESGSNGGSDQAVNQVAGGCYNQGTNEGEMPEVPDIDIQGLGDIGEQENKIHKSKRSG